MAPRIVYIDGHAPGRVSDSIERVQVSFPDKENGKNAGPSNFDWCNSAAIVIDEEHDEITLTISVDDPRGGFGFTVRRLEDGTLIMHVPTPDSTWLHAPLTKLHDGTYRIGTEGAYAPEEDE